MTTLSPVVLYARTVGSPIDTEQDRLVIPFVAAEQYERVFVIGDDGLIPNTFVETIDLVTRQRVRIRRASCGLAACAVEWWPASRTEPVPAPDLIDWSQGDE